LLNDGLLLAINKCSILCGSDFKYLGFQFTETGMAVPTATKDVLRALPSPSSERALMRSLGLFNFFSSLVCNFRSK
jgi:hypothetical protein